MKDIVLIGVSIFIAILISFILLWLAYYIFGFLYKLRDLVYTKLNVHKKEQPLETLNFEERLKDARYLPPWKKDDKGHPIVEINDENINIIIKQNNSQYVSAGWLIKYNENFYGDYVLVDPANENPDKNLIKIVSALIEQYFGVRDLLNSSKKSK